MSVSYFVRYDIEIADLEGFMRRYREVHVPLVARWPGLRRMVLHTPLDWRDPFPVNRGKAVLMVSSYLPELVGICDRIAVMVRGSLGPARPVHEWTEHALLLEATG